MNGREFGFLIGGVVVGVALTMLTNAVLFYFVPWLRLLLSGTPVSLPSLLAMRLRGSPVALIAEVYASQVHAGQKQLTIGKVEATYLAHRFNIESAGDLARYVQQELKHHA